MVILAAKWVLVLPCSGVLRKVTKVVKSDKSGVLRGVVLEDFRVPGVSFWPGYPALVLPCFKDPVLPAELTCVGNTRVGNSHFCVCTG